MPLRLRNEVARYFDDDCELVHWRYAPGFGAHIVVVDAFFGRDYRRVLAALSADGMLWQQSSMSLKRPDRLVYFYEHLMSFSFALVAAPRSALLLGLGGGAMARFLRKSYPECRLTIVEKDEVVIDIARRYFDVAMPVEAADAMDWVAAPGVPGRFDVILVDLYDADGFVASEGEFWRHCHALLQPGGCLAINWADPDIFARHAGIAAECAALSGASFSISPKSGVDNLVQFCLGDPDFDLDRLALRLHEFERPQRRRTNLGRCDVARVAAEPS